MSKFDINTIWNSDQEQARQHYRSLSDVEKLAKKQSRNILNKLYRTAAIENIVGLVVLFLIGYGVYDYHKPMVFTGFVVFVAIIMAIGGREFLKFHRAVRNVNKQEVVEALKEYERLIGNYIRRNKLFVNYFVPLGYLVGFVTATLANETGITFGDFMLRLGIGVLIGLPLVWLIAFLSGKYINWAYGRPLRSMEEARRGLEEEEDSNPN